MDINGREPLIPKHGGYRNLKSFQLAQLVYDVTVRFCNRYIDLRSRTHDQMVQAARSGVQNIAEGSVASGTSKKTELKLTNVARASLEELKLDYEDFLRHRSLPLWAKDDARRKELVARRCKTVDEVAQWVKETHGRDGRYGPDGQETARAQKPANAQKAHHPQETPEGNTARLGHADLSMKSISSIKSSVPEIAANAALVLIGVTVTLLDRQIAAQAAAFENEGGFTERLYRVRTNRRKGS